MVKPREADLKKLLEIFHSLIGKEALKYINMAMRILMAFLPQEYGDEIKGIATAVNMPLGEVVLYNVFYEFFTACTSVLAEDENGKMYHGRNMDFGLFLGWDVKNNTWLTSEILRKILVKVDFQKSGKTVYSAVTFAGYVGVMTAVKKDAFTFSINERFQLDGGWVGLIKWIMAQGRSKAQWLGFLTRDVMLQASCYGEAKHMLASTELIAPAYFILGGTQSGEGCIITRDRTKVRDLWELKRSKSWYILETNYDHWESPLFFDDRRKPANKCMNEMTQKGVGFKGLYNVLFTKPVLNKLTVYTALMQVNDGSLESYVSSCKDPCWPW